MKPKAPLDYMFNTLAAALLAQQVLTQTPCYAALAGLFPIRPTGQRDIAVGFVDSLSCLKRLAGCRATFCI